MTGIQKNTIYTPKETREYLKVSQSTMTRMLTRAALSMPRRSVSNTAFFGKEILRVISPEIEGKVYNEARKCVHGSTDTPH